MPKQIITNRLVTKQKQFFKAKLYPKMRCLIEIIAPVKVLLRSVKDEMAFD